MKKIRSYQSRVYRKYKCPGHMVCCLALCAALFLTACGRDGTEDESSESGGNRPVNAVSEREWVYVPEVITVGDERGDYGRMQPVGDAFCYALQGGDLGDSAKSICRYSLTERELTGVAIDWPEGGDNWDLGVWSFTQDQELYTTANVYPADYSWMKRYLCRFDQKGSCRFFRDITEQADRDTSIDRLTVDSQGRVYIFAGEEIQLYTADGDYQGSVSYSSPDSPVPNQVVDAGEGADGTYYVCISKGSGCALMEIDFENVRLSETVGDLPKLRGFCAGRQSAGDLAGQGEDLAGPGGESAGQYDLLLYDDTAVYGYHFAAHKKGSGAAGEELLTWMDSDINGYCVTNLYLLEDGRLCATVEDWRNEDRVIVALERTKAELAPRREELVIVTVDGESDLAAMAVMFNRGNSRYHLTVKKYESLTDLYNAVLTKEPVDLIDLSGVNVQKLAGEGFFENLAPYVDQSEAFRRSDFVDGILDVYTFDDTLVSIPAAFTIRTVVGSGAQRESKTGLTLEELLAAANSHPWSKDFDGVTREEMMQYIMMFNEEAFINRDTGSCRFDSESFRAVLEYVKGFPDSLGRDMEEVSLPVKIRNGEVAFAIVQMDELRAIQEFQGMFGGDAACVGFPTADGQGGHLLFTDDAYAIAAGSEHKEGAWKFIEGFLAQDKGESYYRNRKNFFGTNFPTLKNVLNEMVEEAIERDSQYESDRFPELIYSDGSTFQYHALTWDEVNVMLDLVPDAKPYFEAESDEIIKIINEEAPAYYSGQKRPEDVAAVIQNRAQLYMNENN